MEMSSACLPPVHAPIGETDRAHPRFGEYLTYRSAMQAQLVECQPFMSWLRETEEYEGGRVTFFVAGDNCDTAEYVPGRWYIGHTPPRSIKWRSYGPYKSEAEARTAADAANLKGVRS